MRKKRVKKRKKTFLSPKFFIILRGGVEFWGKNIGKSNEAPMYHRIMEILVLLMR